MATTDRAVLLQSRSDCARVDAQAHGVQKLARLQASITSIQDTYGKDHLHLTVIKGYVAKLTSNKRGAKYLSQHKPEFAAEFRASPR